MTPDAEMEYTLLIWLFSGLPIYCRGVSHEINRVIWSLIRGGNISFYYFQGVSN